MAGDVAGDGSGSQATGCFGRWFNGPPTLSTPQELTALSSMNERDPWIAPSGLLMYFARDTGTTNRYDLYTATRTAMTDWVLQGPVVNLANADEESRPALTDDLLMLALATDHVIPQDPQMKLRVLITTRPNLGTPFGSPDNRHLVNVNADTANHYDPFLTQEGRKLYLAPNSGPAGRQEIKVATRPDINSDFTTPVNVGGINAANTSSADPALSMDERLIVFSSAPSNSIDVDVYYATRTTATGDFATPVKIPTVNSGSVEGDPMLSPDGCELYFASNRGGGKFHLFRSRVMN